MSKYDRKPAPSDAACLKVWERIMGMAEAYGLLVFAYGGVAELALPEEQRKAGIRQTVLDANLLTETEVTRCTGVVGKKND